MDEDRDRDRGGDDYGDEDGGSWREMGCWVGEIMLKFGVLGWGSPGEILGLLVGSGSQTAASNLLFFVPLCNTAATLLHSFLSTAQVSFSLFSIHLRPSLGSTGVTH